MMRTFLKGILAVFLSFTLVAGAMAQEAQAPEQIVRDVTDEIIVLLRKNKEVYAKDTRKLYAMVDEKVLPFFDFVRMSQWVLGRYWRTATEEQRERFVAEFRNLLVRTYATALLNYTDQKVLFLPTPGKQRENEAVVRTEVQQGGGAPNIPIHYSFYRQPSGDWRVYDVTIEGISLVTNYRSIYASKIKREGMDALIASIATSNTKPPPAGGRIGIQPPQ